MIPFNEMSRKCKSISTKVDYWLSCAREREDGEAADGQGAFMEGDRDVLALTGEDDCVTKNILKSAKVVNLCFVKLLKHCLQCGRI